MLEKFIDLFAIKSRKHVNKKAIDNDISMKNKVRVSMIKFDLS
jgi:hypothetical protein